MIPRFGSSAVLIIMTQTSENRVPNAEPVEMLLNMGPQHPSTHGVFRMVLWVDGEKVVDV